MLEQGNVLVQKAAIRTLETFSIIFKNANIYCQAFLHALYHSSKIRAAFDLNLPLNRLGITKNGEAETKLFTYFGASLRHPM